MYQYKLRSQNLRNTQKFLKGPKMVQKLLSLADINKQDLVLEIGPGKGVITGELLKISKKIIAVEKDNLLYKNLIKSFSEEIYKKRLDIYNLDFLNFKLPDENFKMFSNIPYNITSQIFHKILKCPNLELAYIILQKEAAEKFAGSPYNKETMQSLIYKNSYRFRILYEIKRSNFEPKPLVDSVLLEIKKFDRPVIENKYLYEKFIQYIFLHSKENLEKTFKKVFSNLQIKILFKNLNISYSENLTDLIFEQWVEIYRFFESLKRKI